MTLILVVIVFSVGIGIGAVTLPIIGIIGVIAFVITLRKPIFVMLIQYPLLFFTPNSFRLPFPVLNSPFEMTVVAFVIAGTTALIVEKRSLPRTTTIFWFGAVFLAVIFNIIAKGWTINEVYTFFAGTWSFYIPLLGVNSKRSSALLLVSVYIPVLLQQIQVLFINSSGSFLNFNRSVSMAHGNYLQLSLCSYWISIICLSQGLFSDFPVLFRCFLILAALISTLFLMVSTFASALIVFAIAIGACGLVWAFLPAFQCEALQRSLHLVRATFIIIIGSLVFFYALSLPPLQATIVRITEYESDASGSYRLESMEASIDAFLSSPITGIVENQLDKHNTYFVWAAQYGLLLLVPLGLLFLAFFGHVKYIIQTAHRLSDRILAATIGVGILAYIAGGFITPVQGDFVIDSVTWVHIGLVIVWSNWLKTDPTSQLLG